MATTTPNFGWSVPTSTDLVKDGATAIETLGDSIDASLVDLKGGTTGQVLAKASGADMDFTWATDASGIPATIFDAKGDIIAASAADTASRLAVGTDGQVLTADSTAGTGLKWSTPAGSKNYSLLGTGTLTSGSTVTVSGISNMDSIWVVVDKASNTAGNTQVNMRINGDTASNYTQGYILTTSPATYSNSNITASYVTSDKILLGETNANAASHVNGSLMLSGCATAGVKTYQMSVGGAGGAAGNNGYWYAGGGIWNNSATITSISLISSGTFDAGSFYVYGSA